MWKCTQHTFAGGQQDLTLAGRQDLATYFTSARTLENFLVKRQGCISKRRGTDLVANLDELFGEGWKISHVRAIPFVYERDGGYVLLFVEGAKETTTTETETKRGMFVCSSKGILRRLKKVVKSIGEEKYDPPKEEVIYEWVNYTEPLTETDNSDIVIVDGEEVTRVYDVEDASYLIDIPYAGKDFNSIGYTQSGDTLFVAHSDYPFATIKLLDGATFEYREVNFQELGASQQYFPPIISAKAAGTEGTGAERTVSYVATYVKDGVESAPSSPVFIKYSSPWKETFVITITADKGANEEEPDFYNIYKKSGADYGFIGSTVAAVEQCVPTIDSTSNVKFGEYALTRTSANTVKANSFSTSSSSTVKQTIFNNGRKVSYYGNRTALRGGIIAESSDGITISFKSGTRFTDLGMTLGIASYFSSDAPWANGGYWFDYSTFLYHKPLLADNLVVELYVKAIKGDGTTYEPKTAFVSGSAYVPAIDVPKADSDAQIVLHKQLRKRDTLREESVASEGDVAAIYNRQYVECSFEEAISKDTTLSAEGVTWWVDKIVIKAKKGDVYVAPMISYINCFYKNPVANYVNDDYITPDVSLTPPSNDPHFEVSGKYPSCVALKEQRLVLAATSEQPFTLFFSTTGDLYNFNTHDAIRDDDAIEATIPATEFPEVNHIVSARELLVLCDNGEWVVKPSSGNALTYRTLEIKQQSQIGCSKRLPPLSVGDEVIFAENTSETLRAIKYDWTSDGFVSSDLSVLSQSITRNNPIIDYAYKQHPDSIIVCVLQDGTIATLTYMKEHEVCAWSTARLGGGLRAVGICTDKAIRGGTTDLYILAADASGVYSLLRVREDSPAATVEESLCLDAMRTVEVAKDATEVPSIPKGMVAYDLASGEEAKTLENGSRYAIGYLYTATFRSVTPEAQGQSTIQFELKGAKSAELRLENASAFKIVPTALERETGANYWTTCGDDVTVVDGKVTYSAQDHFVELAGDANTSGAITIKSDSPWPLSLLSYSINFEFDPRLLGQNG